MRVLTRTQAAQFTADAHAAGKRVVFTNGVFDLLHPGHVRYLQARALGDLLIVAINTDRSVRANKGTQPADYAATRACGDSRRTRLHRCGDDLRRRDAVQRDFRLQPDVLVKGADWAHDAIVGRDVVEARAARSSELPSSRVTRPPTSSSESPTRPRPCRGHADAARQPPAVLLVSSWLPPLH